MKVEICITSLPEYKLATEMKVSRVELCSALELGGLTPSMAVIESCAVKNGPDVHVLIRPRAGGFYYSNDELELMAVDIKAAASAEAKGVVFGVLTNQYEIDQEANKTLVTLAKSLNLETTFHRAFDIVREPFIALEKIMSLGFDRLLTSGQQPKAIEGIALISKLIKAANRKIEIMAGGGISRINASEIAQSGVDAIHFSARKKCKDEQLNMGANYEPDFEKADEILRRIA